jgi:ribulose-phosphate 3-epimerase
MVKIAPSIIAANFTNLENEVKRLENAGPDLFHLDVMDGHFVPNLTIGPFIVEAIRDITSLPLDIHLMMENPNGFLKRFAEAGADSLTIHVELDDETDIGIKKIKDLGVKVGLAINPETPAEKIRPFFNQIDILNVMTVNPGFGGQMFIKSCLPKIEILKKWIDEEKRSIQIEVDGGINLETAAKVLDAGAEILVTGSALFTASDTRQFINDLRSAGQNNSKPLK